MEGRGPGRFSVLISSADMWPTTPLKAKCLKMGDAAPQSSRTDGALRYCLTRQPSGLAGPNPDPSICLRHERRTVGRPRSSGGRPQAAGRVQFPPGRRICLGIQVVELITRAPDRPAARRRCRRLPRQVYRLGRSLPSCPKCPLAGPRSFVSLFEHLRSAALRRDSAPGAARYRLAVFLAIWIVERGLSFPMIKGSRLCGAPNRPQCCRSTSWFIWRTLLVLPHSHP